jgi:hypothetical protein
MSASNVTQLERAYRHPFEYISPRLYSLSDDDMINTWQRSKAQTDESMLFVEDE